MLKTQMIAALCGTALLAGCGPSSPEADPRDDAWYPCAPLDGREVFENDPLETAGGNVGDALPPLPFFNGEGEWVCLSDLPDQPVRIEVTTRWLSALSLDREARAELAESVEDLGITWLTVVVQDEFAGRPDASDVRQYAIDHRLTTLVVGDHDERFRNAVDLLSFPLVLWADADGVVAERTEGFEVEERVQQVVDQLIAE